MATRTRAKPAAEPRALTPREVADRLGLVKTASVYQLIKRGQIVAANVAVDPEGRPCWRVSQEDFQAFFESRRNRINRKK